MGGLGREVLTETLGIDYLPHIIAQQNQSSAILKLFGRP
jgi:hypothetical protein